MWKYPNVADVTTSHPWLLSINVCSVFMLIFPAILITVTCACLKYYGFHLDNETHIPEGRNKRLMNCCIQIGVQVFGVIPISPSVQP